MTTNQTHLADAAARAIAFVVCCLCALLAAGQLQAQDIIIKTDSSRFETAIQRIEMNRIFFRKFQSTDTLLYNIAVEDVLTVEYATGVKRILNASPTGTPAYIDYYDATQERNQLYFSFSDLVVRNLTLAYERFLSSGKVSFRIPLSIGLAPKSENVETNAARNIVTTGLGMHVYPFGQSRLSYFAGGHLEYMLYNFQYYQGSGNDPYGYSYQYEPKNETLTFFSFYVNNGINYRFTKNLALAIDIGLGLRLNKHKENQYNFHYLSPPTGAFVPARVSLCYRF